MSNINVYMNRFLKRLKKLFKQKKGFTLIELLVVIGILGILAAALVATIDPFEQLKKATDTNTTNALVEYINANTRYYTTHTGYPWDPTNGANCNSGNPPSGTALTAMTDCTAALISDNELKQAFSSSSSLQYIYITQDVANNQTIGCFNPQSKSLLHNSNTHFDVTGVDDPANCGSTALKDAHPLACFWCTR
jgi:prepilin-type N-terminal cleavage/methylation domain-containing protein